ncbi:MAG: NAD-dependent epimerase/dehydratase family protein [Afipia sp.]
MRIVVTGAGGFIGSHLVRALLKAGRLADRSGTPRTIERVLLVDSHLPDCSDDRIEPVKGDITSDDILRHIRSFRPDAVFHLAAMLTSAAEKEPARAMGVNVAALARLIEVTGSRGEPPGFVFPSSIAVFGGDLPEIVDDDLVQHPQTSYGTHKSIAELMLADATRRGEIEARSLRLPIVLVHPGPPTASVSDRVAAIVRDAVAGRDVIIPLKPETRIPVASVATVVAGLIAMHGVASATLGGTTAINLPALTVSMADIVEALKDYLGSELGQITFAPDAALEAIVDGWPKGFVSRTATAAGISGDTSFSDIIRHYAESLGDA